MEIKKIGNYSFVNEYCSTKTGFAHKTTLFENDREIGNYRVNYINRTWESYTFQSVMKNCIWNILENRLFDFLNNYKYKNGIVRFKRGQKEELKKGFEKLENVKELRELYRNL